MIDKYKIPARVALEDIISLLFGGHDTTSHSISSAMYFIKKNKSVYDKLMKELKEAGTSKDNDYLMNVLKEVFRFDTPSFGSLNYDILEPVEICGVKIPKGRTAQISILGLCYNPEEWQDPLKFIPERFDPESSYFKTPSGKNRSPLSMIIFSYGPRKCPGQTLATLQQAGRSMK